MFGFYSKMVNWIMTCVITPSYIVCLNGERHGFFRGGRGLRQGNPLSPYLFTIIMEVFNLILQQEILSNGRFIYHHGCKELEITHLCFADDLLVMCHGDVNSVTVIKKALEKFSNVYWASVFKLPKLVTKDIEKLFKGLLWNNGDLQRGKAKIAWKEMESPLDSIVSRKEIYSAGFSNNDTVFKCINGNQWIWPNEWFLKYPDLSQIHVPKINTDVEDKLVWKTKKGNLKAFSCNQAWKDIRILNGQAHWWKVIWFSQNIPRQAFVLWMAIKKKLMTQDKLALWYPGKI
ncbi:RNA-directed DNA polymerase, eukaryota, reverse transcriptase zinc-binding domain protein [Tanacetum coccineum]